MKSQKFSFNLTQAYLEMARAFHGTPIKSPKGISPKGMRATNNTYFAFVAHGYVFSVMAVTAFVNSRLGECWEYPDSQLKKQYSKCHDISDLLKRLWKLEKCVNELCVQRKIKNIRQAKPKLWKEFHLIVTRTRNFMIHPKLKPAEFKKIIGGAFGKPWGFPTKIAEEVIGYFYDAQNYVRPAWLKENQDFHITAVQALSVVNKE